MKPKRNLDNYAVLMYVGSNEYWITFGGHAHAQPPTGLPPGTFGRRHGKIFSKIPH